MSDNDKGVRHLQKEIREEQREIAKVNAARRAVIKKKLLERKLKMLRKRNTITGAIRRNLSRLNKPRPIRGVRKRRRKTKRRSKRRSKK